MDDSTLSEENLEEKGGEIEECSILDGCNENVTGTDQNVTEEQNAERQSNYFEGDAMVCNDETSECTFFGGLETEIYQLDEEEFE